MSPAADPDYPLSVPDALAAQLNRTAPSGSTRIAWLLPPRDGSPAFLSIPAQQLLSPPNAPLSEEIAKKLAGKAVLVAGTLPYIYQHRTPLSVWSGEKMQGVIVHAHHLAQLLDGRHYDELDKSTTIVLLVGIAIATTALGWYSWHRQIDFLGTTLGTLALICADAIAYAGFRLILPFTLSLCALILGLTCGRHLGKMTSGVNRQPAR